MARINVRAPGPRTHEGAVAARITLEQQLRRSVMSCLLWESEFYEEGQGIADRIRELVHKVAPDVVASMAIEAREDMKLRHVPLLLVREMARHPKRHLLTAPTLGHVIQRADELAEFLALYWKEGKRPLANQVKRGLAEAFTKFNSYQLAKYNRDDAIKLRDVLFMVHAKPRDDEQAATWKQLVDGTLPVPDTWEVNLSAGEDKRETWERLIAENKLGALALLRNLRNMGEVGVPRQIVIEALRQMDVRRVLPFRFIAAARYTPRLESDLEQALFKSVAGQPKLPGLTTVLVDVSLSMEVKLSERSGMTRMDAACGVAMMAREICEQCHVWTFSNQLVGVPARRGFALRDAIVASQQHGATRLGEAIEALNKRQDTGRLIVITDEQSHSFVPNPSGVGYMINVASNQNGVGYGAWTHIDGWSEAVLNYIRVAEGNNSIASQEEDE